jgi:hypothetical protein
LLITGGGRRATRAVMCMTRALPIARRPTLRQSLPSQARKPRGRTAVRLSCRRSVDSPRLGQALSWSISHLRARVGRRLATSSSPDARRATED